MLSAATWSAIAATFSALSAFLVMRIQRRNLVESNRPELVLTGWTRTSEGTGDSTREVIRIEQIQNVGRGPALHGFVHTSEERDNRPLAVVETKRFPILPAGSIQPLHSRIIIWWKNVEPGEGERPKYLPITLRIFSWDVLNQRHETVYKLLAVSPWPDGPYGSDEIAPGVYLSTRNTITRPVWLLKLQSRAKKAWAFVRRPRRAKAAAASTPADRPGKPDDRSSVPAAETAEAAR